MLRAVRAASQFTEQIRQSSEKQIFTKLDKSPVTMADVGAQAIIISYLKGILNAHIIAEEESKTIKAKYFDSEFCQIIAGLLNNPCNKVDIQTLKDLIDYGAESTEEYFWAIDPIDGTKGFIRGDQYAICIALLKTSDCSLIASVIACPQLPAYSLDNTTDKKGTICFALYGKGAYEISFENFDLFCASNKREPLESTILQNCKKLSVASSPFSVVLCKSVESSHSPPKLIEEYAAKNLCCSINYLEMDSQCKYCLIARGDAHLYCRLPCSPEYREKLWDHAPGTLIVREAGGYVSLASSPQTRLSFENGPNLPFHDGIIAFCSMDLFINIKD